MRNVIFEVFHFPTSLVGTGQVREIKFSSISQISLAVTKIIMSRITKLFNKKQKDILNIYFTAGYPKLDDTEQVILALEEADVQI